MKKSTYLLASLLLCLISTSVFADCAARAVYRAPEIPELSETSYEQVAQLEQDVQFYIKDADQRLLECENKSSPLAYNFAIGRMERVAKAYNELAEFYNRATVASIYAR
ncbi:MAG: hypothetical protein KKF24_12200 [Gammaproteobacteria bacterium]|jgi:hypothetical protein|nr:hypothetical protein [Zhongshania sp.]MBU0538388.1 hypothetical protein [Gammaproteobacteria bacterium]MBU1833444.1 hypothetical protein [Gammaproteobacteria bacterium]